MKCRIALNHLPYGFIPFFMKQTIFILSLLIQHACYSQTCDCSAAISIVQEKVESNLASYQHQVVEFKRENAYARHKLLINQEADSIRTLPECRNLLARYLSFFRDEHLFFRYTDDALPFSSIADTAAVRQFYQDEPVYHFTKSNSPDTTLDGRWIFEDGSFSIQVFAHAAKRRYRIGVMEKDDQLFWRKGQLKMELFKKGDGSLGCIYRRGTRLPTYYPVRIEKNVMYLGRELRFVRYPEQVHAQSATETGLTLQPLSKQTAYLRIPSFDLSRQLAIDSIMDVNKDIIAGFNNLIIDIRNNGGGGFEAFNALLPFVADSINIPQPYNASVWLSPENFSYYDESKYEYAETREDSLNEAAYIRFLEKYKGRFSPPDTGRQQLPFILHQPKKIALLYNRRTASTAEGFILLSKESKRVKSYGENSAGAITYGDWRPVEIPALKVWIAMTTKKMVFLRPADFESRGIQPDMPLDPNNETGWIRLVQADLEKVK